MGKRRSGVWKHFEEEGERKVSCRMCRTHLTTQGNTSIMLRHLRRKHPKMMDGLFDTKGAIATGEGESCQIGEPSLGEETQPLRRSGFIGRKRSGVWRHYEEEGERKVSCRMCHTQITKQGNTSAMLRHLRRKHPEMMDGIFDTESSTATGGGGSWQADEPSLGKGTPSFLGSGKREASTGWKHFQEEDQSKRSYRLPHKELDTVHRSTTSMHHHLHGKQPQLKLGGLQGCSHRKLNYLLQSSNAETHFLPVCERLLQNNQLTDCILMAEGQFIRAHRLVLATCSESFEELFKTVTQANPVVVLQDISIQELRELINYVYKGKIHVKSEDLPGLLKAASKLKIKGLSDVGFVESLLDDIQASTSTPGKTYCQEDHDMEDLDDDYSDHQSKHLAQGQRTCGTPLASSEEVKSQNINSVSHERVPDSNTSMKRVQIKLEHGTVLNEQDVQTSFEIPSPMETLLHHQGEHETEPEIISAQEEVIHLEPLVTHEINSCDGATQVTTSISHAEEGEHSTSDPLAISPTVIEDGGGIGLTEGEPHIHISTPGTTPVAPSPQHSQSSALTHTRKYSKGDLLAAVNLVRSGHLGVKAASRAFNIPPTTLFKASKRPDSPTTIKQEVDKPIGEVDKKLPE